MTRLAGGRPAVVAAVDLGASGGRVMAGRVGPDDLDLTAVHRFGNEPVEVRGTLHWNTLGLYAEVLAGLRATLADHPDLASVGIDSWGCDFGLLDGDGRLLGDPVHYRDRRTDGVLAQVSARLGADHLYDVTGIQALPFNTVYQLVAAQRAGLLDAARTMLPIPDLLSYWLTGEVGAEITNASTTQLLDVRRRGWALDLVERLGLPGGLLPRLREPGEPGGALLPAVTRQVGADRAVPVTVVGSHDTASAVVGVPARDDRFLYVSCGTWSLVGVELDRPVLTEESRLANFTNESGVDGTVRYLRNVMGLWLLQEAMRGWAAAGDRPDLAALLAAAAEVTPFAAVVDCDDPVFLPPGDMPARIADACRRTGQPVPGTPAEVTRCILDSLALAYRRTARQARELSGRDVDVVHVVGGGARNGLLCQLTADACGLPVLAGPVEATALGNVLVQARAVGAVSGGLAELRSLVARTQGVVRYEPRGHEAAWAAAERRLTA
ncbi:rhamnulokinase [Micromonospora echinospora]|uniref:Rhamnulokinase n=1 Tax=Micromonospora echinospora TaxID=1877 RepID=A0A1C4YYL4_MICEC|nr:rhamnulokinase family protein [Micromonospora echinospora]SCF25833.1 rhamnulokinase [Micromonospora echinospora]